MAPPKSPTCDLPLPAASASPSPGRALDDGIVRTLWLTPAEIEASRERHRSPLLLRCVQDHRAGRRYPLDLLTTTGSVGAQP